MISPAPGPCQSTPPLLFCRAVVGRGGFSQNILWQAREACVPMRKGIHWRQAGRQGGGEGSMLMGRDAGRQGGSSLPTPKKVQSDPKAWMCHIMWGACPGWPGVSLFPSHDWQTDLDSVPRNMQLETHPVSPTIQIHYDLIVLSKVMAEWLYSCTIVVFLELGE